MKILTAKRIRRTAEEAQALILATAERRLSESGIEGLTVQGVAKDAGISHASVIHHFGSTDDMRKALLKSMTENLLQDIHNSLLADVPPSEILSGLFDTMSGQGHGKLMAWRALSSPFGAMPNADLFIEILRDLQESGATETETKMVVMLVACAALGFSISGEPLQEIIGLSESDMNGFSSWLGDLLVN